MYLTDILKQGEHGNVEFKLSLSPKIHLSPGKRQKLASQMKYRIENGKGKAIYVIGVNDRGEAVGLSRFEFEKTLSVLKVLAAENLASIVSIERYGPEDKLIGKIVVEKTAKEKINLVVATAGHVDSGKSSLVGSLVSGIPDNGAGKTRLFLDTLPHEIERGLSAELSYAVYGFRQGETVKSNNPLNKQERARIVEHCEKIISFVDCVGHEPWLRTTIRGIVGQQIDYGLLTVDLDSGITNITKEHLGVLLAMNIPVIVAVTKIDRFPEERLNSVMEDVERILKYVGRIPIRIRSKEDIAVVIDKINNVTPIILASSVTLEGLDLLDELFKVLPPLKRDMGKPFLMYIDKVYNIKGVGTVVTGAVKQGVLKEGEELLIGPDKKGEFRSTKALSIETHHLKLHSVKAGFLVGVALRGIPSKDIERGMVLCSSSYGGKVRSVKKFLAEVLVLTHPTRIMTGYEPVLHIQTISEAVKIKCLDKPYLKAGDIGKVTMTFKYHPYFIEEGDKFVFREGKTKGIGKVLRILEP